ncbi:cation:proton antiporter regulatory subunit [Agromyces bauzanensis]|uniref:Potassium transporter TrkA n=1 Tax=Agromyces bauzanensis TaxID=1308924 RepID=A0A917PG71_9MICO|nr:TrkA C-terminal domain-containing protein [Agromyces bauzanensis]GGJ75947.1 potassium transporter TrkA [Agromyces bauzanensis]
MVDVRRVDLPGIGVLHSFDTTDALEISVVAHRAGVRDLLVRHAQSDEPVVTARLETDEAHQLAELLGGTRIIESIADVDAMPGVPIGWVSVHDGDAVDGRELGSVDALGDGTVQVIAIVRGDRVHASPAPDFRISAGDMLVAAGAPDRIAHAFRAAGAPTAEHEA